MKEENITREELRKLVDQESYNAALHAVRMFALIGPDIMIHIKMKNGELSDIKWSTAERQKEYESHMVFTLAKEWLNS